MPEARLALGVHFDLIVQRAAEENVVRAFQRLGKFRIVELENFTIHLSHLLNQVLVLVALTPREQKLYSAFVDLQRFLAASMQ